MSPAALELHQQKPTHHAQLAADAIHGDDNRSTLPERPHRKTLRNKLSLNALLQQADIEIDGSRPWDLEIHDERFYDRVFRAGDLGTGLLLIDRGTRTYHAVQWR
jgi:hypothetical protein